MPGLVDGVEGGTISRDDSSLEIDDSSPVEPTSFSRIKVLFGE